MSITNRLQSTQISPKVAGISIGCLLFLSVIGINAARKIATGEPPVVSTSRSSDVQSAQNSDINKNFRSSHRIAIGKGKAITKADTFDPCQLIVKRNIFKSIMSAANGINEESNRPGATNSLPPMAVSGLPSIGSFGSIGGGSSRNIAFTGVVETPEGKMALLENTSTSETRLAAVGDYAFGMEVLNINSRSVSLDSDGSNLMLALGENKSDTANANNQQQPGNTSSRRQRMGSFQPGSQSSASTNITQNQNQDQSSSRDQQNQQGNSGNNNFGPPPGGFGGGFGGPPPGGF